MGKLLDAAIENAPDRRRFLSKTALFGAAAFAAAGLRNVAGQTTSAPSDADILNFALNLEYLEAEFYTVATTGMTIDKMGIDITGSGTAGATTGGAKVSFSSSGSSSTPGTSTSGAASLLAPMTSSIASEIAYDERAHVAYIRAALTAAGATPIAKPAINLDALKLGFGGLTDFLQLARVFEDIGVTAYAGAAPLISSKTILGAAARIAQTEAEHAANIRLQIALLGIATTPIDGLDILPPPSGGNYFSVDKNALTETRTPGQVLYLAYGNTPNATSGGFFPSGVNGTLNMSSTAASMTAGNGTTAVVTPTTLTTSQASVTLDASGSQSGSGKLTYFFMVLPGGLKPALLQSPNSPQATVDFVSGPGTYLIQLTVTDAKGNTSSTAPITLIYMP
ncbi:MAG TPA: ferritin-like domain-containing protein [Bryobacteraceae bacterium]|nr:ferritin-like domain-containing protein [Bryobacteraceae bacterium]